MPAQNVEGLHKVVHESFMGILRHEKKTRLSCDQRSAASCLGFLGMPCTRNEIFVPGDKKSPPKVGISK